MLSTSLSYIILCCSGTLCIKCFEMVCMTYSLDLFNDNICIVKIWASVWESFFTFRDQKPKRQSSKTYHNTRTHLYEVTLIPTLAAVFLITVVHAVQHVIAAPAPGDTVSAIQTEKLIFSALLHTANLPAKNHRKSWKLSLLVMLSAAIRGHQNTESFMF